jgi:hypothetical protein
MPIARTTVLLIALALALPGCGSPWTDSAPASPSVSRADPAAAVMVAELNAGVRTTLQRLNSGAFTHQSFLNTGDGSVTITRDGTYDLKAHAWALRMDYASDSAAFRESMGTEPDNMTVRFLSRGQLGFYSMQHWPTKLRGRWLQVTGPGTVSPPDAPVFGDIEPGEMDFLAAFSALRPTELRPFGQGWTLVGEVDAVAAIQALGLAGDFRAERVKLDELEGRGQVAIDIQADGSPTTLQIDGSSMMVTSTIPQDLRDAMLATRASVLLRDLGEPVEITVPRGRKLIDADEMS